MERFEYPSAFKTPIPFLSSSTFFIMITRQAIIAVRKNTIGKTVDIDLIFSRLTAKLPIPEKSFLGIAFHLRFARLLSVV